MGVKNTMLDLNDHLFAELERLGDEELTTEQLKAECMRAKAISEVAKQVVANAANVLKAAEFNAEYGRGEAPRILVGDDPKKAQELLQLRLGAEA